MDKSTLLFAIITFASFAAIAITATLYALRRSDGKRRDAVVFSVLLDRKGEAAAADFLKKADFPVAFDIVIQHLGTERENFFVVAREDAEKAELMIKDFWPQAVVSRSGDYLIFHHGGFYDAFRTSIPEHEFGGHDISAVDLSRVNELGEGAVVRFFRDPSDKDTDIKILGLFSAPSQYQLREMEDIATMSFKGRKIYSPKNKEEVFRAFGSAEEIAR
jgi:hypothetical protein